jgi:hypothetical protein
VISIIVLVDADPKVLLDTEVLRVEAHTLLSLKLPNYTQKIISKHITDILQARVLAFRCGTTGFPFVYINHIPFMDRGNFMGILVVVASPPVPNR